MSFIPNQNTGSGNSVTDTQTVLTHGFVVGDVVYHNGTIWLKASAASGTSIAQAVVSQVVDVNNFKVVYSGILTATSHGKIVGEYYYLDQTVAGTTTFVHPTTGIVQQIYHVKDANTLLVDISNAFTAVSTVPDVPLTYGRVLALLDLASTTHINTDPGTKIPFTGTTYTSGMTTNAGSIIPSIAGRYRADWLCMATSTDFLADGIFFVVQNGLSVGQVSYNMNEASAVNQSAGFIDVNLVADLEVSLHYRTRHTASDGISWDRGSYFQLTQLPTAVAPIVDVIAEYGENNSITNLTTFNNTLTNIAGSSFTLPTAGTWEVIYNIFGSQGSPANGTIAVYDSLNVIVPNSTGNIAAFGNSLVNLETTNKVFITTTGAATYQLKGQTAAGTMTVYNTSTLGVNNSGNSKITWKKIAGGLPSTGQTVDYVSLVGETGDAFNSVPSFTLTSDTNAVITSVAPTTARLPFTTQTSGGTMTVTNSGNITVGSNNVTVLKTVAYSINASVLTGRIATSNYSIQLIKNGTTVLTTSNGISGTSVTRDTQSINWTGLLNQGDTIDIRVKDGSSTSVGVARYSLVITQLGSSAVIAGVYPGTWTTYTPTITATAGGTTPTLPTGAFITGSYTVQGKVMLLNIRYSSAGTALATAGTQSYSFNLPGGYTIDTTKAILPTDLTNASLSGFDGSTIGTAYMRNAANNGAGTIVAVSTIGVGIFSDNNARLVGAGSFSLNGASNTSISLVCQIPLL